MAYMFCDIHGGGIPALVSKDVRLSVDSVDFSQRLRLVECRFSEKPSYLFVDEGYFRQKEQELGVDLSKPLEDELVAYEFSLDLVPVCSSCLKDYLHLRHKSIGPSCEEKALNDFLKIYDSGRPDKE